MPLQTLTATLENMGPWLAIVGFGAYHGLNPAMGWLFALALGLQQDDQRAIWMSMLPIALGHAASIAITAVIIVALQAFISIKTLQVITALLLLGFGAYKLFNWYRHPRWVGMRVSQAELVTWSFLMATAHGAGLMLAPALLGVMPQGHAQAVGSSVASAGLAVGLHTLSMLLVMAVIAWIVYNRLGLMVLRKGWVNFDLIWSFALLVVGGVALVAAV